MVIVNGGFASNQKYNDFSVNTAGSDGNDDTSNKDERMASEDVAPPFTTYVLGTLGAPLMNLGTFTASMYRRRYQLGSEYLRLSSCPIALCYSRLHFENSRVQSNMTSCDLSWLLNSSHVPQIIRRIVIVTVL
jgi:hypothetical protein